jgi:hypothetical protein
MATAWSAALLPVCPITNTVQFCDVEDLSPPASVKQLIYSPTYHALVVNSGSEIATIDLSTYGTSYHPPKAGLATFTDIAISPSGRYVFAADYGGDNAGSSGGNPYIPNYVHRLDLASLTWDAPESAWVAGKVQAVSDDQVILQSLDQWVTFTNDQWTGGSAMTVLNASNSTYYAPGYYPAVYAGNIRYVGSSGRLIHADFGSSSQEIEAFRLSASNFAVQESSGVYGSAQGYGGTTVLATDQSVFYYGSLAVDPLDVTHNLHVYQEWIYAATGDLAFGGGGYYDTHTTQFVGTLGVSATIFALNPDGSELWAFDATQILLRHFVKDDLLFRDGFGG